MHVIILAIGRLRDAATRQLTGEYLKRLSRHLKVEVIEVRTDEEALRRLDPSHHVVALDTLGEPRSSKGFAQWLHQQLTYGRAPILFLIGGADGLSEPLRTRAKETLSLGPLTLPHRLARVVLVEQLYRAMAILKGEPYHK